MPRFTSPDVSQQILKPDLTPTIRFKNWMDSINGESQIIEGVANPNNVVIGSVGWSYLNRTDATVPNYFLKVIQGGDNGWVKLAFEFSYTQDEIDNIVNLYDGLEVYNTTIHRDQLYISDGEAARWVTESMVPESIVEVYNISDFPDPVDSVITLAAQTTYLINADVDVGSNQIVGQANTRFQGNGTNISVIRGKPAGVLFAMVDPRVDNVTLVQDDDGGNDLMSITGNPITNSSIFKTVTLVGGDVKLISGFSAIFDQVRVIAGARIIQPSGAGVSVISINGISQFIDSGTIDGIVHIEAGGTELSLSVKTTGFVYQSSNSVGIVVDNGANIAILDMNLDTSTSFGAQNNVLLRVGNPNDIQLGVIKELSLIEAFGGTNTLLACQPTSSSTLSATGATSPFGICQDNDDTHVSGNIIVSDPLSGTDKIYRYEGISNTANGSLNIDDVIAVAWFRGDLYTLDHVSHNFSRYDGFSTTQIGSSITTPDLDPVGMTFIGEDLVSIDDGINIVYVHDGFSSTILFSFNVSASVGKVSGVAFDGVNLLIADSNDNTIAVMKGVSNTLQYKFSTTATDLAEISLLLDRSTGEVGFAFVDNSDDTFQVYDQPVTFDHSSPTWELTDIPGVTTSSDRGGVAFSDTVGREVTIADNNTEWHDVADSGDNIFYNCFSEVEKMVMDNEENGEILWIGVRDRGRTISGQVTFSRGGPTTDVIFELSLAVNGTVQKDSITAGVVPNNGAVLTMGTLPISRDLVKGDLVKIQIRRLGVHLENTSPDIGFSKVAIT